MDNLPRFHTYTALMYNQGIQEVYKHFVQDLNVRPQNEAYIRKIVKRVVGRMIY